MRGKLKQTKKRQNIFQNGPKQITNMQNKIEQIKSDINQLQDILFKQRQNLSQNGLKRIAKMQNLSSNDIKQITKIRN